MKKWKAFISVLLSTMLSGCVVYQEPNNSDAESNYDFDHKVQFFSEQLDDDVYRLEVTPTSKTRFSQLSAFAFRKSLEICGDYDFTMKVEQGVPYVGQRAGRRSYIQDTLVLELNCQKEKLAE